MRVNLFVTTLNKKLARKLEPRASSPQRRLQAITALHQANIPVSVLVAPIIPVLTDTELEKILSACHNAGAQTANYVLVRLPREVTPLFENWLHDHFPGKENHVMNRIRDSHDGKTNDPRFGHRMRGHGFYADMIQKRFAMTVRKLGLNQHRQSLNQNLFHPSS